MTVANDKLKTAEEKMKTQENESGGGAEAVRTVMRDSGDGSINGRG
jgi:hypothetical protein